MLTTEQTKIMISGITQSLNSGFSSNLNAGLSPALTPGGLASSGTFSSSLTQSCLPPSLPTVLAPSLQPGGLQAYMGGVVGAGGAVDPGALQQLKLLQIRKPLLKSALVDSNMTEEEVNMNFVQDLLNWVEEMQVRIAAGAGAILYEFSVCVKIFLFLDCESKSSLACYFDLGAQNSFLIDVPEFSISECFRTVCTHRYTSSWKEVFF